MIANEQAGEESSSGEMEFQRSPERVMGARRILSTTLRSREAWTCHPLRERGDAGMITVLSGAWHWQG